MQSNCGQSPRGNVQRGETREEGEIKLSKWQNRRHVALSFRLEETEERLIERGGRGSISTLS